MLWYYVQLTGTVTCLNVYQFPNGVHESWVVTGFWLDLGDDIGHGSSMYYDCLHSIVSVRGVGILLIPEPPVGLISRDKHRSCSQDLGCLRKTSLLMPVKRTDSSGETYSCELPDHPWMLFLVPKLYSWTPPCHYLVSLGLWLPIKQQLCCSLLLRVRAEPEPFIPGCHHVSLFSWLRDNLETSRPGVQAWSLFSLVLPQLCPMLISDVSELCNSSSV